jgi:phosphoserine phosphatase
LVAEDVYENVNMDKKIKIMDLLVKQIDDNKDKIIQIIIKYFQEKNLPVLLISNSPSFYVKHYSDYLNIIGVGANAKSNFTLKGNSKLLEVKKICLRYSIDLKTGLGFGNCHQDLDFLKVLSVPILVRPKRKCKEIYLEEFSDIIQLNCGLYFLIS